MLLSWLLLVGTVDLSTGYDFDYDIIPDAWCNHQCQTEEEDIYQDSDVCEKECIRAYTKANAWSCDNDRIVERPPGECSFECKTSSDCNDVDVCCYTPTCGMTCVSPDLTKYEDFPPIPTNVTILEHKKRTAKLYWDSPPDNDTIFLIQSRQSIGCKYFENYMSHWHVLARPLPTNPPAIVTLKPGFWYEIRLAAVNRHGTRGFSKASSPFKLSKDPRPPGIPRNIRFTYGGIKNGKVWGRLEWNKPHSMVPIKKYVIYWSNRLLPENRPSNMTSIFQHIRTLMADNSKVASMKIPNLSPGLQYFLQVEAQIQCGKRRLSSPKAGYVLSVNSDVSGLKIAKPSTTNRNKSLGVRVEKVQNKQGKISAKIVWAANKKTKYAVSWSFDNFSNETIVLNASWIELENLHFNKLYNVTVTEQPRGKKIKRNGSAAFIADPDCPHVNRNECS